MLASICQRPTSTHHGRFSFMFNSLWIIYALVFGAALLGVQAFYWLVMRSRNEPKIINRRLTLTNKLSEQSAVLEALRHERGFGALGDIAWLRWFDELVMQSGVRLDVTRLLVWYAGLTAAFYIALAL